MKGNSHHYTHTFYNTHNFVKKDRWNQLEMLCLSDTHDIVHVYVGLPLYITVHTA